MRAFVLAVVLFAGAPASALDPWTESDTQRQLVLAALAAVDIAATDYAIRQEGGPSEGNPLLGSHPSSERLWGLGAAAVAGHALVSWLLPREARDIWQAAGISVELSLGIYGGTLAVSYALD